MGLIGNPYIINLSVVTTKIVTNNLLNVNDYCNVGNIRKEQLGDEKLNYIVQQLKN